MFMKLISPKPGQEENTYDNLTHFNCSISKVSYLYVFFSSSLWYWSRHPMTKGETPYMLCSTLKIYIFCVMGRAGPWLNMLVVHVCVWQAQESPYDLGAASGRPEAVGAYMDATRRLDKKAQPQANTPQPQANTPEPQECIYSQVNFSMKQKNRKWWAHQCISINYIIRKDTSVFKYLM